MSSPNQPAVPRSLQLALFVTGVLWLVAAQSTSVRSAEGFGGRFGLGLAEAPLQQGIFVFLLLVGFAALSFIATRRGGLGFVNALPARCTTRQEFGRGAALGWGMLLVAVLPMMVVGDLHPTFTFTGHSFAGTVSAFLTIALGTLALELGFRGYIYQRLIAALGPSVATLGMAFLYAMWGAVAPNATSFSFVVTLLFGLVYSLAYLRTHALWVSWGMHFAWAAATAILFGLPVSGVAYDATMVQATVSGREWFTGGAYGPEGCLFAAIVLLGTIPVVYRVTREYAWEYTQPEIVAAGYAMDIAPPKAHTDMEAAAAAAPVPLVQILGTTSTTASTNAEIDRHLRNDAGDGV
ncbi:MAG: type II CAAX endopeptidase family protein [Acidobacteriota bacterium]